MSANDTTLHPSHVLTILTFYKKHNFDRLDNNKHHTHTHQHTHILKNKELFYKEILFFTFNGKPSIVKCMFLFYLIGQCFYKELMTK